MINKSQVLMFSNSFPEEYMHLTDLVSSEGWKVFKRIVKWRKGRLADKIVKEVRHNHPNDAKDYVSAMDELDEILELVKERIDLSKTKKEES